MNALAHLGIGCALLALAGCSDPHDQSESPEEPSVPNAVRELMDDAVSSGFSGVISLTADGTPLTREAHGLADRDSETANTPETAFDVGSILKLFTATAIFRLTDDGVVTSIEAFDGRDRTILLMFGERKPGKPELAAWQSLVARLEKQAAS